MSQEEQQLCSNCGYKLEGEELDYTVCRSCYEDEMRDVTRDWEQR
jgi:exosome complex RNA-binding protein Csl4